MKMTSRFGIAVVFGAYVLLASSYVVDGAPAASDGSQRGWVDLPNGQTPMSFLAELMKHSKETTYNCGNFYDYVCANHQSLRSKYGPLAGSWWDQEVNLFEPQMKQLAGEDIKPDDTQPVKMVKSFFKRCESFYSQTNTVQEQLKQFPYWPFPSLEGGPVTSECDDWTITDVVTQFMAIGFDVFDINFHRSIRNQESYDENLYSAFSISYNNEALQSFADFENTVEVATSVLKTAYKDYKGVESQINATIGDLSQVESETSYNSGSEGSKIFLRDLMKALNAVGLDKQLDILKILRFKYPELELNENTLLVIKSLKHDFIRIAQHIFSGGKKTIANKLIVHFVSLLRTKTASECSRFLTNSLGFATLQMMSKLYVSEEDRRVIRNIFDSVADEFQETLLGTTWLSKPLKAMYFEKLRDLRKKFYIGFPPIAQKENEELLVKFYDSLGDDFVESNFTEMKKMLIRFEWGIPFRHSNSPNHDLLDSFVITANDWFDINAGNYLTGNFIYVTYTYLGALRYHKRYPIFLQYATIGFTLSHEILHGFTATGLTLDQKGKNITKTIRELDPYAWGKIMLSEACYDNQYSFYKMRVSTQIKDLGSNCHSASRYVFNLSVDGKKTLSENMPDSAGLKMAFRAYKKWKATHSGDQTDYSLPGFEVYSLDQQFFMALAYQWCGEPKKETYDVTDPHSPTRVRITGLLESSPEFYKTFQCDADKHTPETMCSLW